MISTLRSCSSGWGSESGLYREEYKLITYFAQDIVHRVMPELVALIGDIVDSRSHADQAALLEQVAEQLRAVDVAAVQPITPTVGDEFQAVFETVESALLASVLIRLRLLAHVGAAARFGFGRGVVTVSSAAAPPFAQSGTAWWEARAALGDLAQSGWPKTALSAYRGTDAHLVNGFLMMRDELIAGFDAKDAEVTLGLFAGERQEDIAEVLGVSQPAVSQRIHRGPYTLYLAHKAMVTQ